MAPAAASRNVFRPGKPASAGRRRQRAGTCQTWHVTAGQAITAVDRPDAILAFLGAGLVQRPSRAQAVDAIAAARVTVEILMDSAGHTRLPVNDFEENSPSGYREGALRG